MKFPLFRVAAAILSLAAISASEAATYTYNETTSTTTQWAAGTSWDATPVSAVDTILSFTGDLVEGTNVVSNNDIVGNFLLNELDFTYNGTSTSPAPTVTISGNPLEFSGAGAQITYNPGNYVGSTATTRPQLIINSDIIMTSALTVASSSGPSPSVILNGAISGDNSLTFSGAAGATVSWVLTNTGNSYTGDTRLTVHSTSNRSKTLQLGASEVIPNGVGKGDLYFQASNEQGTVILDMNGFNETINGLASISPDRSTNGNTNVHQVRNDSATNATLTIGDADASATYIGRLLDGSSSGTLGVTKVGSGTQVLSGLSTHTGDTTIEGGTLKVDYSIYGTSETSDPTDYFSSGSTMILGADTTFSIEGRGNGATTTTTGVNLSASHSFVLSNSIADTLVVGQELLFTKTSVSGNPVASSFIVSMDRGATDTIVYGTTRLSPTSSTVTVDTTATIATTNQTLAGLTLSGAALSNATIDLGSSDNVILTISSAPVQLNDGSTLTIANWDGSFAGGGGDQWIFDGATTDFSSVFTQSEIIFDGYGAGYNLIDYGGSYEVVAVPEPSTFALLAGSLALLTSVRRRRKNVPVS